MNTETPASAATGDSGAPHAPESTPEPALYAPVVAEDAAPAGETADPCPDFLGHIPADFFDF